LTSETVDRRGDYEWARRRLNEALADLDLNDPQLSSYYGSYLDSTGNYDLERAYCAWTFYLLDSIDNEAQQTNLCRWLGIRVDRYGNTRILRDAIISRDSEELIEPTCEQIALYIEESSNLYRRFSGRTNNCCYEANNYYSYRIEITLYDNSLDCLATALFDLQNDSLEEFELYY